MEAVWSRTKTLALLGARLRSVSWSLPRKTLHETTVHFNVKQSFAVQEEPHSPP